MFKFNVTRAQELEAGTVLAVLGFTMTFTILIILTLSIKAMSIVVSKYVSSRERKRPREAVEVEAAPAPPKPVEVKPPTPTIPVEAIAAAITGVRLYLEEKMGLRKLSPRYKPVNYWVLSWRIDSTMNLNELDYTRWNKSRRIRW